MFNDRVSFQNNFLVQPPKSEINLQQMKKQKQQIIRQLRQNMYDS